MANLKKADLLRQAHSMVTIPSIVDELNALISNSTSSTDDFAKLISTDPALSLKLLRIVNSSYYQLPHPVDTISRAVTIVGIQSLSNLVMASCLVLSFNQFQNSIVSLNNFWRHSINCGIHARAVANLNHNLNAERFFTAGLVHDIGSLLLYQFAPELSSRLSREPLDDKHSLDQAELELFGFTSAELGADLAATWKLPAFIETTIRFHRNPEVATSHKKETTIIYIANHLANISDMISNRFHQLEPIDPSYWEFIGVSMDQLEMQRVNIKEQLNEMTSILFSGSLAA